ncbi:DUF6286 domain-containing protein [Streptomyces turgidiscabies]|uniref:DUF6286 domain-containing protein n=1 Tax=Streptomyces turgidiscabies (strain Car8) TaxID=698760 RepID=L7FBX1_STRT8|nr:MULTISPECIES: DUF6286 domain-containing protein [Streptomyces]ELP68150.1 hypothetical protein STRTUCAR8_02673 [Streptomyces turgidiscabies Car8]MDX3498852.1 DUF6286 domain-containing protein [Streptomyces turgidiscabies]GAQ76190.1 hypothetical protein T45_07979 [Streptomyces turgidiscabies]
MSEPQGFDGSGNTRRLPVLEKPDDATTDTPGTGQSSSTAAYDPLPVLGDGEDRNGRFWSARRVPAAVLALLLFLVAGAFLYDITAVRARREAMSWRKALAGQLAERPLDDTWVLVGAGVAVALGTWLLVLAVTPGLRGVLPMRRTHADVRAGLHRAAAAMVLRDRAMEVSGVQSVRVRMTRTRADVRALSHFRELDDVRADLDDVLTYAIRSLGLSRPPALSVHVARPGRKG